MWWKIFQVLTKNFFFVHWLRRLPSFGSTAVRWSTKYYKVITSTSTWLLASWWNSYYQLQNILHDVGHIRNVENVRKDRMLLAIKVISKKWSSRNAHAPVCRLCERCFPNRRIVIGGHESIRRLASINVKRSRQELITTLHSLMIVISFFDRQFWWIPRTLTQRLIEAI